MAGYSGAIAGWTFQQENDEPFNSLVYTDGYIR